MKFIERISIVVISVLIGIGIGWFLRSHMDIGVSSKVACGANKLLTVFKDGILQSEETVKVCGGDQVQWKHVKTDVKDFTIHFDLTPFDQNHGQADYNAGDDYPNNPDGTDSLAAQAVKVTTKYKYTITAIARDGSKYVGDPHIIVAGTGKQE